jgi:hypothetical protein
MRPIFAAIVLSSFAASAYAGEPAPDLRAPTRDEINYLAKHCSGHTIVPAGTVGAYGELFEAPLLVSVDKDRILIDGVQVIPRPLAAPNFQAQKIAGRIHSRFYLDEMKKGLDASARAEERLNALKTDRTIDEFKIWKRHGKLASFQVTAGGGQARVYLDNLPLPLMQKFQFILAAVFREYLLKEESDGKEPAQAWLQSRLEELKAAGKIDEFKLYAGRDAAKIRFPGETSPRDYGLGEDKTPFGVAYANRWKARRKQTEAAVQNIVERLKAGGVLLYSFKFEKESPRDEPGLAALRAVAEGKDPAANAALVRERFKLTGAQADSLGEEYK